MRRCRNRHCGREFWPPKPNYYFCCWSCYEVYWAEGGHEHRRYWDGFRSRSQPKPELIPPHIWKALAVLVHPDRWQGTPALLSIAHEAMVWLNRHRPTSQESER
jgi:hypothetical protein